MEFSHGKLAPAISLERLGALLSPAGLILRHGFHPVAADCVPDLPDGRATGTVILAGNAGADMWYAYRRDVPSGQGGLNRWLRGRIRDAAAEFGAHALFPGEGPPFAPVQDWAQRSEPVSRSPLGMLIHPEFGLWHAYRAIFCFAETIELPKISRPDSPCDGCATKPCLQPCPVDAFKPDRFDDEACVRHVASPGGRSCRERGCMARRACPAGRAYIYPVEAQNFHMEAFLKAAAQYRDAADGGGDQGV